MPSAKMYQIKRLSEYYDHGTVHCKLNPCYVVTLPLFIHRCYSLNIAWYVTHKNYCFLSECTLALS